MFSFFLQNLSRNTGYHYLFSHSSTQRGKGRCQGYEHLPFRKLLSVRFLTIFVADSFSRTSFAVDGTCPFSILKVTLRHHSFSRVSQSLWRKIREKWEFFIWCGYYGCWYIQLQNTVPQTSFPSLLLPLLLSIIASPSLPLLLFLFSATPATFPGQELPSAVEITLASTRKPNSRELSSSCLAVALE